MGNMKSIACTLMIIRILAQARTLTVNETGLNIAFGIMAMILADYGWKKKKNKIITAIKENVL